VIDWRSGESRMWIVIGSVETLYVVFSGKRRDD
jgi:hypothetical protein